MVDRPDSDEWKKKYYASLSELDQKEKSWQQREEILRTLVSRLTKAADRRSEDLNQKLKTLNIAITGGMDALKLKSATSEVGAAVESLDQARAAVDRVYAQHFVDLIKQLKPAGSIERPLATLAKEIRKAKQPADITFYTRQLSEVLVKGLNQTQNQTQDKSEASKVDGQLSASEFRQKSSGFLGGLFSKRATDSQGKQESGKLKLGQSIEALPEKEPQGKESLREKQKVAAQPNTVIDLEGAASSLYELLDRFELTPELQVEAKLIQRSLLQQLDETALVKGLEDTLQIAGKMLINIREEKRDIENFLSQLTDRLLEMDLDLRESTKLRELSQLKGDEMTATVDSDVKNIQAGIDTIQDLAELKTVLMGRVVTLRNNMDDFLSQEQLRNRQSLELIDQLTSKVSKVEKEADGLRQQLEQKHTLALRDVLTEVPNRLAYEERIETEMARFRRKGQSFVMVLWDIDHFKKINDSYGHASGDKVLKMVASTLQDGQRESDFFARFGGEEFVSILPETNMEGAAILTEKLRAAVQAIEFHSEDMPVDITLSCGYGLIAEGEELDALFARVDKALYDAKESGRNCCKAAQ